MQLLHTNSLADTVDAVNEALFFDTHRCKNARRQAAQWIVSRIGLPGAYAGMPTITEADCEGSLVLFTGEKINTDAGRRHILGEEACRAIRMLVVNDPRHDRPEITAAVERAEAQMVGERLDADSSRKAPRGTFCCAKCSVALWRNLTAGGMNRQRQRLADGLRALKAARTGDGKWRAYPYWYTLSALIDIPGRAADTELRYASPGCQHALRRRASDEKYATRRRAIAQRVLERAA